MAFIHNDEAPTNRVRSTFQNEPRAVENASAPGNLDATISRLRLFSLLLCLDAALADRLVEVTLLRARPGMSDDHLGDNTAAWLCARLRGYYFAECAAGRKGREICPLASAREPDRLAALARLTPEQREALVLTQVMGFSPAVAARVCRMSRRGFLDRAKDARAHYALSLSSLNLADIAQDPRLSSPSLAARA